MVAIFYIDDAKWSVGRVKKIADDGQGHVVFKRAAWPYSFEGDRVRRGHAVGLGDCGKSQGCVGFLKAE
jgi:hypothetical protein